MLLDVNIFGVQKRFGASFSLFSTSVVFTTDSKNDFQTEISNKSSPSDMEGFEEENCDRILFSEASVNCSARLNSENESAAGPRQQNKDNRRINLEW